MKDEQISSFRTERERENGNARKTWSQGSTRRSEKREIQAPCRHCIPEGHRSLVSSGEVSRISQRRGRKTKRLSHRRRCKKDRQPRWKVSHRSEILRRTPCPVRSISTVSSKERLRTSRQRKEGEGTTHVSSVVVSCFG